MPVDLQKIKQLREKLGLTQEQAARAAGFKTRQSWNLIESGKHIPRVDTLERVADALGVKAKDLLR